MKKLVRKIIKKSSKVKNSSFSTKRQKPPSILKQLLTIDKVAVVGYD